MQKLNKRIGVFMDIKQIQNEVFNKLAKRNNKETKVYLDTSDFHEVSVTSGSESLEYTRRVGFFTTGEWECHIRVDGNRMRMKGGGQINERTIDSIISLHKESQAQEKLKADQKNYSGIMDWIKS